MLIEFFKTIWNSEHLLPPWIVLYFQSFAILLTKKEKQQNTQSQSSMKAVTTEVLHRHIVANRIEKHHFKTAYRFGFVILSVTPEWH